MKALCKKSKILDEKNCLHNRQVYEMDADKTGYSVKVNKTVYRFGNKWFKEYFFDPVSGEHKNMLRTQLIDKILNEK